jgi:hypothetical protein
VNQSSPGMYLCSMSDPSWGIRLPWWESPLSAGSGITSLKVVNCNVILASCSPKLEGRVERSKSSACIKAIGTRSLPSGVKEDIVVGRMMLVAEDWLLIWAGCGMLMKFEKLGSCQCAKSVRDEVYA